MTVSVEHVTRKYEPPMPTACDRHALSSDARAFWIAAPGRGEIRDETLPRRAATTTSWCARSSAASAAAPKRSCSTAACRPASTSGCARRFRPATFPAPVKYGYASVGLVEQRAAASSQGRRVFCLYPHQTRYVVPAAAVHVLPDDVPPARAVLAANLETAINGLWDARAAARRSRGRRRRRHRRLSGGVARRARSPAARSSSSTSTRAGPRSPQRSASGSRAPETASEGRRPRVHASGSPAGLALALESPASKRRSSS